MKIGSSEMFETKRLVNNWEKFTGRFRVRVSHNFDMVCFDLPGRGGRMTQKMARKIDVLWQSGLSAGQIATETGCPISH